MIRHTTLFAALFLLSCGDKAPSSDDPVNIEAKETVSVKATSHKFPKETIIKASIAPKSGMNAFSSHILLLSDSGKVYTTNTAFGRVELVHAGPATDISGFQIDASSPGFLVKMQDGTLEAYSESASDSFEKISSVKTLESLTFCESQYKFPGQTSFADGKRLKNASISLENSGTLTLSDTDSDSSDLSCDNGRLFSVDTAPVSGAFLGERPQEEILQGLKTANRFEIAMSDTGLVMKHEGSAKKIEIEAGLSIGGIENPQWVFTTSQPLGNTFNHGVTLVRGDGDNRIVMIANDYLAKTVFADAFTPPDNQP